MKNIELLKMLKEQLIHMEKQLMAMDQATSNGKETTYKYPLMSNTGTMVLLDIAIQEDTEHKLVAQNEELTGRLESLVKEFKKPEWEIWCDHAVGICACKPIRLLEDAENTLNKTKTILMSTKAAHTDLPWSYQIAGSSEGKEYFEVTGMNTIYWVAKVRYQFTGNSATPEELANGKANAELIVTAVNHHQELITRLYNLVNSFPGNYDGYPLIKLRVEEARETLKKLIQ